MANNRGVRGWIHYQSKPENGRWITDFSRSLGGAMVTFTQFDVGGEVLGTSTHAVLGTHLDLPLLPSAITLACADDMIFIDGREYDIAADRKHNETSCLSWVHLSDLHFTQPSSRKRGSTHIDQDRESILDAMLDDCVTICAAAGVGPDMVLVTGDIAQSGDAEEYAKAKDWFSLLATTLKMSPESMFFVPGNHDVDRRVCDADRGVRHTIDAVRRKDETMDDALEHDREHLARRMKAYQDFVDEFHPAWHGDPHTLDVWHHERKGSRALGGYRGLNVHLLGFNTALLCQDDADQGKLQIGRSPLNRAKKHIRTDRNALVVALVHHPIAGGWLADQDAIDAWTKQHVDILLSGHVHVPDLYALRGAAEQDLIRVFAGATHATDTGGSYGYSVAQVIADDDGDLALRVWSRTWDAKQGRFRSDAALLPDGRRYSELPISRPSGTVTGAR